MKITNKEAKRLVVKYGKELPAAGMMLSFYVEWIPYQMYRDWTGQWHLDKYKY